MTDKNTLSLDPLAMTHGEWQLRLAQTCRDCAVADGGEEADLLRLAFELLLHAPDALSSHPAAGAGALFDHLPPRARFDALLALGACDSAAIALMPEQASYILSRSTDAACLASVLLPGMDEEMTSEGESPALALVSALMGCLASVANDAAGFGRAGEARRPRCGDAAQDVTDWQVPAGTLLN